MWGVHGWALSYARPPVLGACGRGPLPTGCGCWGSGRGDLSPTTQRVLLQAGSALCGGGTRAHRGGPAILPGLLASGIGRSPEPDRLSVGRAAGARYPRAVGAGSAGLETWHQLHCARSCELALFAVGAARGRPGGGASPAWARPVRGWALSDTRPPVLGACNGGRLPSGCGCGGFDPGDASPTLPRALLRARFARCGGGTSASRGGGVRLLSACGVPYVGRSLMLDRPSFGRAVGTPTIHWLWLRCAGVRPGLPRLLLPCRGSSCVVRPSRVGGTRWLLLLGTCPCAVGVAGGVPLWGASRPRVAAPRLVWSGRPLCFSRLSCCRGAFPYPGGFTGWLRGARGGRRRSGLIVPAAGPCRGRGAGLAPRCTHSGAPRWGCPWRLASASVLGWVRCGNLTGVDPVPDASGFPCRPSFDGGLGWCTGADWCERRHLSFRVGGCHARVPCVCACGCSSWLGRASRPPGRVLVRLAFPFAVLSFFFVHPLRAGVAPARVFVFFLFFFFLPPSLLWRPCCLRRCLLPGLGALGLGALRFLLPPPRFLFPPLFPPVFPALLCSAPLLLLAVAFSCLRPRMPPALVLRGLPPLLPPCFFVFVFPRPPPPPSRLPRCVGARCCRPLCFMLCVSLGVVLWMRVCLPCAALWPSGALLSCCSFGLHCFWRPVLCCVPVCCGASCGVLQCGLGRAAGCMVCCAAACCAVFFCVLSCRAAVPLVRCCGVLCWRACVVLLCCAPLCCPALAWLLAVVAACPPALACALCLVLSGVAVLCCPSVPVAVFDAACAGVVSRLALLWAAPRCAVLFVPRFELLLRAVRCLQSCRPAALFALWFAVWFCCALPCAVVCCVPGCCAAPRCSALCCAVFCCAVWCRWWGAAACCVVPSSAVRRPRVLPFPALYFVVCPRALCSVLCVCTRGVVLRAVVRCCALCCGWCGVSCCAFPVLSALCSLCCTVLVLLHCALRVACVVSGARCCGVLLCVVLLPAVCCGAVLGLAVRGRLQVACFGASVPVWPRGLLPCGWCGLLRCPAPLCCVLCGFAVVRCSAVVLCCAFAALFVFAVSFLSWNVRVHTDAYGGLPLH